MRHGLAIALLPVLCLLAAGCAKKEAAEAESVAPVEVAAVAQDSIRLVVEGRCRPISR